MYIFTSSYQVTFTATYKEMGRAKGDDDMNPSSSHHFLPVPAFHLSTHTFAYKSGEKQQTLVTWFPVQHTNWQPCVIGIIRNSWNVFWPLGWKLPAVWICSFCVFKIATGDTTPGGWRLMKLYRDMDAEIRIDFYNIAEKKKKKNSDTCRMAPVSSGFMKPSSVRLKCCNAV